MDDYGCRGSKNQLKINGWRLAMDVYDKSRSRNRKNIFREPRDEPLVATILRKFLRNPRRTVRAPAGSSSLGMNGVYFEPGSTSALPTSMTVRRLADASGGLNQFFSLTGEATPFKFARD